MKTELHDVLIIGGGPAGLTAALYLGRARKTAVVIDRGAPRHAASPAVHNFLTRDGMKPAALRGVAWEQMATYPTVTRRQGSVVTLNWKRDRWIAHFDDGQRMDGRAVLLATGVVDQHPELPGFAARWGHAIHHCPYCHGWEMRDRALAVMAQGEAAGHMAPLLKGWTDDVVLLTHGGAVSADIRKQVRAAGIPIYDAKIAALRGPAPELTHIELSDGTVLERQGLFVKAPQQQVPLVNELGLELDEMGYVKVDRFGATSRPMLWAAGDLTTFMQQVVAAAAQGALAGATINGVLTLGHGA